jgi:hypothetical protein
MNICLHGCLVCGVGFIQDTESYAWLQHAGIEGVQATVITMKLDYVLRIY